MSGTEYLADTNAVIYLLSGNMCMEPYLHNKLAVSVISVMELLSFPGITDEDEKKIRSFLNLCERLQINYSVIEKTIQLRKSYKIKLPDSIIAATSLVYGVPLITADAGFFKIKNLQLEILEP